MDGWQEHFAPCIPSSKLSPDEEGIKDTGKYKGPCCQYPKDKDSSICPACYLLGANGLNGFVRIPFLRTTNGLKPAKLYSTKLDRVAGVANQGNRSYDVLPIGTKFNGSVEVVLKDDVCGWELGKKRVLKGISRGDLWLDKMSMDQGTFLQEFLINRLTSIKLMGGYKSKGCGSVKIEIA